jgi:hypothetical protein
MSFHRFSEEAALACHSIPKGAFRCPCCGFPTLESRDDFDICNLCWWEDGPEAITIGPHTISGPNGSYSLAEAQANFEDHGDMYRYDDTRNGNDAVSKPLQNRLALLSFVQDWDGKRPLDRETFSRLLAAAHAELDEF